MGIALRDAIAGYVAGSQFYVGYDLLRGTGGSDEVIHATFESGQQPIFGIAGPDFPTQSSLEFCYT